MKTYKLMRYKGGKLYPLFVEADRELPIGEWLEAHVPQHDNPHHVKSKIGPLSLRPGFHSTEVPWTDWIGKYREDGVLVQRKDTVWAECEVEGDQIHVTKRYGLRTIPEGWYYFNTRPRQIWPWVISDRIKINRILSLEEVKGLCHQAGVEPQPIEE